MEDVRTIVRALPVSSGEDEPVVTQVRYHAFFNAFYNSVITLCNLFYLAGSCHARKLWEFAII